jgi:selenium metabolism protein YedF
MVHTVDARGLPCPQPVILTRNAMRVADEIVTLVSGADQVENVRRLAEKAGWQVTAERQADAYAVHLRKGAAAVAEPEITPDLEQSCALPPTARAAVVVVPSEQMGRGEAELGGVLMRAFFHTLLEVQPLPRAVVFYNSGVKLVANDSPILEDLRALQSQGVELLVCGTCVNYYNLKERLGAGIISNMYAIAELLLSADHLITL